MTWTIEDYGLKLSYSTNLGLFIGTPDLITILYIYYYILY